MEVPRVARDDESRPPLVAAPTSDPDTSLVPNPPVRDFEERYAALVAARRREEHRARVMHQATVALVGALTPSDVASIVVGAGKNAIGAAHGRVMAANDEASRINPDRVPLFLSTADECATRWPANLTQPPHSREAAAILPLGVDGRAVGTLFFEFDQPHDFSDEEVSFLLTLAAICAQGLDRAHLYEAEQNARRLADAASEAKSQFLARMSHELRTPLNAIAGHADLLDAEVFGPLGAAQREAIHRIHAAERHLLGLINDILNYAKLRAGHVQFSMQPVRVSTVLESVVPLVELQMGQRGIALDVDLPEHRQMSPTLVWADPDKLQQILINLLSNAIKFTPRGGRVRITSDEGVPESDTLLVAVSDTGVGIAADRLTDIFDPFVQVNGRLDRDQSGTGLGLSISRDLATGMGGTLDVTSHVGVGSTFTLTLQRAPDSVAL